jgi:hypothetical protein
MPEVIGLLYQKELRNDGIIKTISAIPTKKILITIKLLNIDGRL